MLIEYLFLSWRKSTIRTQKFIDKHIFNKSILVDKIFTYISEYGMGRGLQYITEAHNIIRYCER